MEPASWRRVHPGLMRVRKQAQNGPFLAFLEVLRGYDLILLAFCPVKTGQNGQNVNGPWALLPLKLQNSRFGPSRPETGQNGVPFSDRSWISGARPDLFAPDLFLGARNRAPRNKSGHANKSSSRAERAHRPW